MKKLFAALAFALVMLFALSSCEMVIPGGPDSSQGGGSTAGSGNNSAGGAGSAGGDNGGDQSNPGSDTGGADGNSPGSTEGTQGSVCPAGECIMKKASEVPASCTSDGYILNKCTRCKREEREILASPGHTEKTIPATENKTEGTLCTVCGTILKKPEWVFASDYESPSNYDGTYGYSSLLKMNNGAKLGELYMRIDAAADDFHVGETNADSDNVVSKITYSDLGISTNEAIAVWTVYSYDHPLYYWLSKSILHNSSQIHIKTDPEYKDFSVRAVYNEKIYSTVKAYMEGMEGSGSAYDTALYFHDRVITDTDYAYDSQGRPEDESWAHNILGVIDNGEGVCESYAKAFSLLLNFRGIENIYVTGDSRGQPHAWNLAKMDDGRWYWFDLTWDDSPDWMLGIVYNYFCISSSENTNWNDGAGSHIFEDEYFFEDHKVTVSDISNSVDYLYTLPAVSEEKYESVTRLRTVFEREGIKYAVISSGAVALVEADKVGELIIPERVTYNGCEYEVEMVGAIDENGRLQPDTVIKGGVYSELDRVSISKTVRYIFPGAFNLVDLEQISADPANAVYTSVGGILYSKDKKELIWVPQSMEGEVRLPEETVSLPQQAFMYRSRITKVTLSAGIESIPQDLFNGCTKLETIVFLGTRSQWETLEKGSGWLSGAANAKVICSDDHQ